MSKVNKIKTKLDETIEARQCLLSGHVENPLLLVKIIEKATRMEIGKQVVDFFSDPNLVYDLIDIAGIYKKK